MFEVTVVLSVVYLSLIAGALIKLYAIGVRGKPLLISIFVPVLILLMPVFRVIEVLVEENGEKAARHKNLLVRLFSLPIRLTNLLIKITVEYITYLIVTFRTMPIVIGIIGEIIVRDQMKAKSEGETRNVGGVIRVLFSYSTDFYKDATKHAI